MTLQTPQTPKTWVNWRAAIRKWIAERIARVTQVARPILADEATDWVLANPEVNRALVHSVVRDALYVDTGRILRQTRQPYVLLGDIIALPTTVQSQPFTPPPGRSFLDWMVRVQSRKLHIRLRTLRREDLLEAADEYRRRGQQNFLRAAFFHALAEGLPDGATVEETYSEERLAATWTTLVQPDDDDPTPIP